MRVRDDKPHSNFLPVFFLEVRLDQTKFQRDQENSKDRNKSVFFTRKMDKTLLAKRANIDKKHNKVRLKVRFDRSLF
jgi:hypothetical protein